METKNEMTPHFFKIASLHQDSTDLFTIGLDTGDFPYQPGQFNMLYAFGAGESAISISGHHKNQVIHTIRKVGSVTGKLAELKIGDQVGVRGPFGKGWPLPKGKDFVIVAGGIGLAPLRPVLRALFENRQDYGKIHLIYGARNTGDLIYTDELAAWKKCMNVLITVDTADATWSGHVGVVTPLVENIELDIDKTVALMCGPEIMMRFTASELQKKGLGDDQIYVSMERNMKCATAHCGHCQFGPHFICKDGPVFKLSAIKKLWVVREM